MKWRRNDSKNTEERETRIESRFGATKRTKKGKGRGQKRTWPDLVVVLPVQSEVPRESRHAADRQTLEILQLLQGAKRVQVILQIGQIKINPLLLEVQVPVEHRFAEGARQQAVVQLVTQNELLLGGCVVFARHVVRRVRVDLDRRIRHDAHRRHYFTVLLRGSLSVVVFHQKNSQIFPSFLFFFFFFLQKIRVARWPETGRRGRNPPARFSFLFFLLLFTSSPSPVSLRCFSLRNSYIEANYTWAY